MARTLRAEDAAHAPDPGNPSRRRVIFTGIAGIGALALARWLQPAPPARADAHRPGLSADGTTVMRALVPALLDGALPLAERERSAALDGTIGAIATAIGGLPPSARQELDALFALLAFAPLRMVLAGIGGSWRDVDAPAADAFLQRLRASRWRQKRAAYDALHQLTFAAWYANPGAWLSIGYPGPPDLA